MPLPAILGIPWLAGVLGGLFGGLVTFFVSFMTKKLALTAAFVVGSLGLFAVFFAVCWSALQGVIYASPPELGTALAFFLPSNAPSCLGAILTVEAARWIYDWNTKVIQFRLAL